MANLKRIKTTKCPKYSGAKGGTEYRVKKVSGGYEVIGANFGLFIDERDAAWVLPL